MTVFDGPCLWCGRKEIESDLSHIVPQAVGVGELFLEPGYVCKPCNQYFGTAIEPRLLREPMFHIAAVTRRVVNLRKQSEFRDAIFDDDHPAVGGFSIQVGVRSEIRPRGRRSRSTTE